MDRLGAMGRAYRPETDIPLLDGRLVAQLPAAAVVEPVAASLMGAPAATGTQTRVVLDVGAERLVMMTDELFQIGPTEFRPAVEASTARWALPAGTRLQVLPVPPARDSGIDVVAVARAPLDRTRQAVPVMDAFVRHADTTVQQLSFYVSPNAADDTEGCGFLAFQILRTLTTGPRPIEAGAGTRRLTGPAGEPALDVTVPPGWVLSTRRGVSFVVHTLTRLMPFGGASGSVNVYLGGSPSPLHRQVPPEAVRSRPGTLAGRQAVWYDIRTAADGQPVVHNREALVGLGQGALHAYSTTTEPGLAGEIGAIMDSIGPLSH